MGEGAKPRQGDATRPPPCANSRRDSNSALLEVARPRRGNSQRVMTEPMCKHNERVELLNQIELIRAVLLAKYPAQIRYFLDPEGFFLAQDTFFDLLS